MGFLMRCAFWIALVFLVVPMVTGRKDAAPVASGGAPAGEALPGPLEAAAGSALGAMVAEMVAQPGTGAVAPAADAPSVAVLSDIVRFCGENGEVCEAGFSAINVLGTALGEGLTLIGELTGAEPAPVAAIAADDGTRVVATTTITAAAPAMAVAAGTLTADDVAEPWRGTAAPVVAGSQARLRLPPPDPRRRSAEPQG